jgi:hypothetical protein
MFLHLGSGHEGTVKIGLRLLSFGVCLSLCLVGCRQQREVPADKPVKSHQSELLDLAFRTASAIPVEPHLADRSKAQEAVVTACLDLDQPQRALRFIRQIEDWRRGAAYADLAFYCARHDRPKAADSYLNLAAQVAQQAEDWRKDRIKAKIAQAQAYMGQAEAATRSAHGIEASESGKVAHAEAMVCPDDSFDKTMQSLAAVAASGQFDAVKNVVDAYAELFNRFYATPEKRTLVEGNIRASWGKLPVFVQIELLMELAGFSLAHADRAKALEFVNEAGTIRGSANWQPEFSIPFMARLAGLRFRAGDQEKAKAEAKDALNLFQAQRDTIANIYRAGVLRPIAEAYQEMSDTAAALNVYGLALEAGVENPNARPRAEDLAATCCSMALQAVDPGPQLGGRIHNIREGLGDPW